MSTVKMTKNYAQQIALMALFLIILIDSIGASLILPLLEPLFLSESSVFSGSETFNQSFMYGLSLMSFAVAMFIGAPLMGDLSDRFGRKKTLLYCLWGTLIGYLCSAVAILWQQPVLFIIGRVIDGFTAGSLPVAQAGIIDVSSEEKRVKNLGYILFAVSIAYVAGPLIGGILSKGVFPTHFPLVLAASIALMNILILQWFYQEVHHKQSLQEGKLDLTLGFKHLLSAIQDSKISKFAGILCILQLAWTFYFQFIGFYVSRTINADSAMIAWLLLWIGAGMALAFCFLVGKISSKYREQDILFVGFTGLGLLFIGSIYFGHYQLLCAFGFLGAIIYGVLYPTLLGVLSKHAAEDKQGLIMGIAGSISALSAGVTALIGGIIMDTMLLMPFYVLGALLIMTSIFNKVIIKS